MTRGQVLVPGAPAGGIMFCDEALAGETGALPETGPGPWARLTGPAGGLSEAGRKRLRGLDRAPSATVGEGLRRADTQDGAGRAAGRGWHAGRGGVGRRWLAPP